VSLKRGLDLFGAESEFHSRAEINNSSFVCKFLPPLKHHREREIERANTCALLLILRSNANAAGAACAGQISIQKRSESKCCAIKLIYFRRASASELCLMCLFIAALGEWADAKIKPSGRPESIAPVSKCDLS